MNDFQILKALTQEKTPPFPSHSNDELNIMRDMLENLCQRCWASDPARRPKMRVIVGDLRPETMFLQGVQSPVTLKHYDDVSKFETTS